MFYVCLLVSYCTANSNRPFGCQNKINDDNDDDDDDDDENFSFSERKKSPNFTIIVVGLLIASRHGCGVGPSPRRYPPVPVHFVQVPGIPLPHWPRLCGASADIRKVSLGELVTATSA